MHRVLAPEHTGTIPGGIFPFHDLDHDELCSIYGHSVLDEFPMFNLKANYACKSPVHIPAVAYLRRANRELCRGLDHERRKTEMD